MPGVGGGRPGGRLRSGLNGSLAPASGISCWLFSLDFGGGRNPDGQGFAAFGQVSNGLEVARAIQAMPADAEEQLTPPVVIRSARLIGERPSRCRN
jgi:hypothetical protein